MTTQRLLDAQLVASTWVRCCVPWLWDRSRGCVRDLLHPRYTAALRQACDLLAEGYSAQTLIPLILAQKSPRLLLCHLVTQPTVDADALPITPTADAIHPFLYTPDGFLKASVSIQELMHYGRELFKNRASARRQVRALVTRFGLDLVLYMMDCARTSDQTTYRPEFLSRHEAAARSLHAEQLRTRKQALAFFTHTPPSRGTHDDRDEPITRSDDRF